MDFLSRYDSKRKIWEEKFPVYLDNSSLKNAHPDFRDAVLYSMFAGGKRLRPVITLEMAEISGIDLDAAMKISTGIECLHTYSLVHDDLPAMDNDDFRRGVPTSHKKFGEDVAILVGDALQSLSFELIASANGGDHMISFFAKSTGAAGLISGQYLDIKGVNVQSPGYMEKMHRLKTGNLLAASIVLPFIYKKPSVNYLEIEKWGLDLGHLFQIVDDILDATGTSEKLGKTAGKDASQNKLTYVQLFGLDKSRDMADELAQSLIKAPFFVDHEFFRYLPEFVKNREM